MGYQLNKDVDMDVVNSLDETSKLVYLYLLFTADEDGYIAEEDVTPDKLNGNKEFQEWYRGLNLRRN